jgi:hypothetical protein
MSNQLGPKEVFLILSLQRRNLSAHEKAAGVGDTSGS